MYLGDSSEHDQVIHVPLCAWYLTEASVKRVVFQRFFCSIPIRSDSGLVLDWTVGTWRHPTMTWGYLKSNT